MSCEHKRDLLTAMEGRLEARSKDHFYAVQATIGLRNYCPKSLITHKQKVFEAAKLGITAAELEKIRAQNYAEYSDIADELIEKYE